MSSLFDFDEPPDQYAVMGNPVSHSKSPQIHAEFARQTNQQMEYSAIQVDQGGFAQAIGNFQSAGGKGLNITVPFKREAWEFVNTRSDNAEQAGAVNTITCEEDGSLYGNNTDGIGLVRDIVTNHHSHIKGRRILIIGAGGAVRGVIGPLLSEQPQQIVIANRTIDKAILIADEFAGSIPIEGCGLATLADQQFDLIINGTSASLHGEIPDIPAAIITPQIFCYDMMYGEKLTAFLSWANSLGATKTIDGLGMLVEQAAESFYIWRGIKPDTQSVIKLLRNI